MVERASSLRPSTPATDAELVSPKTVQVAALFRGDVLLNERGEELAEVVAVFAASRAGHVVVRFNNARPGFINAVVPEVNEGSRLMGHYTNTVFVRRR